jgi:hypothetical protein
MITDIHHSTFITPSFSMLSSSHPSMTHTSSSPPLPSTDYPKLTPSPIQLFFIKMFYNVGTIFAKKQSQFPPPSSATAAIQEANGRINHMTTALSDAELKVAHTLRQFEAQFFSLTKRLVFPKPQPERISRESFSIIKSNRKILASISDEKLSHVINNIG